MNDRQYPSEAHSDAGAPPVDRRAVGDRRQSSRLGAASADPTLDADGFTRLLSSFGRPLTPDALAPLLDDLMSGAAALLDAEIVVTRWHDAARAQLVLHRAHGGLSTDPIAPALARGESPCGQVLERCEPAVVDLDPSEPSSHAVPHAAPLRSAFVVPIAISADDLLGSLTLYRRDAWTPSETERRAIALLVDRVVQAAMIRRLSEAARSEIVARQTTEEALRVSEARLRTREATARLLASIGETLAGSLDYDETLDRMTRLVVPALADWCVIDLLDDDAPEGEIIARRVATTHADAGKQSLVEALRRYPPRGAHHNRVIAAIRTGETQLVDVVGDDEIASATVDAEHAALLRALDTHSVAVVPLSANGRVRGAISFVRGQARAGFNAADLETLRDVGFRATMALANASLYREAQDAARAKGEFLAVMSHELRTPLNAILGYTGLLADGITGPVSAPQQHQLDRVRGAAHHLLELIDETLTLSRLESGREELTLEPVDARTVVDDVLAMLEPTASSRGLRLDIALPESPVVVRCDAVRFRQVLLNLVSNAIKFTEQGAVTVSVRSEGSRGVVTVRDTGIGIAPEHLPRVFESFWRADPAATRRLSGAGLGLAISQRLVRSMAGELEVESSLGEGTLFLVRLPLI